MTVIVLPREEITNQTDSELGAGALGQDGPDATNAGEAKDKRWCWGRMAGYGHFKGKGCGKGKGKGWWKGKGQCGKGQGWWRCADASPCLPGSQASSEDGTIEDWELTGSCHEGKGKAKGWFGEAFWAGKGKGLKKGKAKGLKKGKAKGWDDDIEGFDYKGKGKGSEDEIEGFDWKGKGKGSDDETEGFDWKGKGKGKRKGCWDGAAGWKGKGMLKGWKGKGFDAEGLDWQGHGLKGWKGKGFDAGWDWQGHGLKGWKGKGFDAGWDWQGHGLKGWKGKGKGWAWHWGDEEVFELRLDVEYEDPEAEAQQEEAPEEAQTFELKLGVQFDE